MCNIYMTSESENKLKSLYSNIKSFYIFDCQAFIKSLAIDMSKPSSIYLVNDEITRVILAHAKLKKYKGIIYINKHLSEELYYSFKQCFGKKDTTKIILIDNGQFPKHQDIMDIFDEVIFYERFRKNKIIECNGFEKNEDNVLDNILMDENND